MSNIFQVPRRLPLVAPSILSADFARMGAECRSVLEAGADALHLDVMDGHFVPNLTMGPDMCRCLRRAFPEAFLDVHLMVTHPERFVRPFVDAGANHLTFHVEVVTEVAALAEQIRAQGVSAGLAINPPTPVERLLPWVGAVDLLLVMSVNPGYSGQAFIVETLTKTEQARRAAGSSTRVQMDGGVAPGNAARVRESGCDVLVAASAVFGVEGVSRGRVIEQLRGSV